MRAPCGSFLALDFISEQSGWAVLARGIDHREGGRLYATSDGGSTWRQMDAPAPTQDVCLVDEQSGFLATDEAIHLSQDGGQDWTQTLKPDGLAEVIQLGCAPPLAAWALVLGGGAGASHSPYVLFHSSDGRDWKAVLQESHTTVLIDALHDGSGTYLRPLSTLGASAAVLVPHTPPVDSGQATVDLLLDGGKTCGVSVPSVT